MKEKRNPRRSVVAVSLLVLLTGCAGNEAKPAPPPAPAAAPPAATPPPASPAVEPPAAGPLGPGEHAPRVTQFSKRFKAPVGLSDDQVKQIKAIEQHAHDEKPTGDQAARHEQWVRQNDKMFADARAILDADQQIKFDEWVRTEKRHQAGGYNTAGRAPAPAPGRARTTGQPSAEADPEPAAEPEPTSNVGKKETCFKCGTVNIMDGDSMQTCRKCKFVMQGYPDN